MLIITNAKIVMPDRILNGSVMIENGKIEKITSDKIEGDNIIDAKGKFLLPGLIDIHGDDLEKEISPRPSVNFPMDFALINLDRKTAACGITTKLHAIAYFEDELKGRHPAKSKKILKTLNRLRDKLFVNNLIHARCEISSDISDILQVIDDPCVKLISIMDHTPGQGQFKNIEDYKAYHKRVYGLKEEEIERILNRKREHDKMSNLRKVLDKAHKTGIPIASHDDDTDKKVEFFHSLGIEISEFPVTLEAAKKAKELGMIISMGAPNVVRGRSSTGNLSAIEAIKHNLVDVLCSDYSAEAMLYAPFILERKKLMTLNEAVNLVSLNPARAIGMDDEVGSIEPGKQADLIIVDKIDEIPVVTKTIVNGKVVYSLEMRK